jgi:hypothetical protein
MLRYSAHNLCWASADAHLRPLLLSGALSTERSFVVIVGTKMEHPAVCFRGAKLVECRLGRTGVALLSIARNEVAMPAWPDEELGSGKASTRN